MSNRELVSVQLLHITFLTVTVDWINRPHETLAPSGEHKKSNFHYTSCFLDASLIERKVAIAIAEADFLGSISGLDKVLWTILSSIMLNNSKIIPEP